MVYDISENANAHQATSTKLIATSMTHSTNRLQQLRRRQKSNLGLQLIQPPQLNTSLPLLRCFPRNPPHPPRHFHFPHLLLHGGPSRIILRWPATNPALPPSALHWPLPHLFQDQLPLDSWLPPHPPLLQCLSIHSTPACHARHWRREWKGWS